jgi:hypothetical protein
MMLVDFFIDMNMSARRRRTEPIPRTVPGNGEATKRLERLQRQCSRKREFVRPTSYLFNSAIHYRWSDWYTFSVSTRW